MRKRRKVENCMKVITVVTDLDKVGRARKEDKGEKKDKTLRKN